MTELCVRINDVTGESSSWRQQSMEERRTTRRTTLLQAALEIIGTRGAAALTTRSVAQETGLVARYIYESFESRDDLLRAVFDEVLAGEVALLLSAFDQGVPEDVYEGLTKAFTAVVEHWREDPRVVRVLFVEPQTDPALEDRAAAVVEVCERALVANFLEPLWGESRTPVERDFTATAVTAAAIGLFAAWNAGRLDLSTDELVTLAVDMVRRIVGDASGH